MAKRRVLAIGLDGFDLTLAERFIAEGDLPHLATLRGRSARYDLEHGRDRYSGLAWEHVSSGQAPSDGARWSAVSFDPATYVARQATTTARPVFADLSARTVVFDVPYCDLGSAPAVRGLTAWGAHDPGVHALAQPPSLHAEVLERFGPYPASEWIYGFCWPSPAKARASGEALTQAVDLRARVTRWLFTERLPDWDLAVTVVSEAHSAIEPLWHGIDATHPLHGLPSAADAGRGLREVYRAIDRLIGGLHDDCPDATLLLFAMHGMGPNGADVPAMVLLPELLYRHAFKKSHMRQLRWPAGVMDNGIPLLAEDENWERLMMLAVPKRAGTKSGSDRTGVIWIPAARYAEFWPRMVAFALPSYYDGRIRINLKGREAQGLVPPANYRKACDAMMELVSNCLNAITGEEVVEEIYAPKQDPFDVGETEADVYVVWKTAPLGLVSPRFGTIGPVPYRRTGGHTGARGFLYMAGEGIAPGDGGCTSAFDVVPTIIDLLGEARPPYVSGRSLMKGAAPSPQPLSLSAGAPSMPLSALPVNRSAAVKV